MVRKISERATKALENATSTKDEALTLEEEIKEALNRTRGKCKGLIRFQCIP